ncbi:MAG: DUF5667 domain-containing protein, partial [Anaerolineae bacterium]|nr:DUF5667 domain-containing protein [Anaerolineae bacterium]
MKGISDAILFQCLEQLDNDQPTERVLADCSGLVDELRQVLETTRRLETLSVDPPPAVEQQARARFLVQAAKAKGDARASRGPVFRPRWLAPVLAVLLLLLVAGTTAVRASGSALPGDALYGTKRAVEQVRLLLASSPEAEAELMALFHEERLEEVTQLLGAGRSAEVSFEGILQSVGEEQWTVGGLPVAVDSITNVVGVPRVGAKVAVTGWIHFHRLFADEIRVLGDDGPSGDDKGTGALNDDDMGTDGPLGDDDD